MEKEPICLDLASQLIIDFNVMKSKQSYFWHHRHWQF